MDYAEAQERAVIAELQMCTHDDIFLRKEENIKRLCFRLRYLITNINPDVLDKYGFILPYLDAWEKNPNRQATPFLLLKQEITRRNIDLKTGKELWDKALAWKTPKTPKLVWERPSRIGQYLMVATVIVTIGVIYKFIRK